MCAVEAYTSSTFKVEFWSSGNPPLGRVSRDASADATASPTGLFLSRVAPHGTRRVARSGSRRGRGPPSTAPTTEAASNHSHGQRRCRRLECGVSHVAKPMARTVSERPASFAAAVRAGRVADRVKLQRCDGSRSAPWATDWRRSAAGAAGGYAVYAGWTYLHCQALRSSQIR